MTKILSHQSCINEASNILDTINGKSIENLRKGPLSIYEKIWNSKINNEEFDQIDFL